MTERAEAKFNGRSQQRRPPTATRRTGAGRCQLARPVHLAQVLGPHQSDAAVDRQTDDDRQVRHGAADGDHDRLEHVTVGRRRLAVHAPVALSRCNIASQ